MEKRYQVFISSTFTDLKDERQAVLKAILELGHMPAGMEIFPAADDSAWQLIRDVIDASDYYVVIIGGRYGSLDETGLSYTEKEYDHAVQVTKPVIPLLHERPDNLPREKTETDELAWKRLQAFRAKVEKRHTCVYWNSAEELKAKVIVGVTSALKRHPAGGWVRADEVPSEATVAEILALRNRIADLQAEAEAVRLAPPKGTEGLDQGEDHFEVNVTFVARDAEDYFDATEYSGSIELTWNEIFGAVAPTMINEATDADLRNAFRGRFSDRYRTAFGKRKELRGRHLVDFRFLEEEIETCIVQLRALGLMRESVRQRSLRDTGTYWCLTPYGDYVMTQLRAIRRQPVESETPSGQVPESTSEG